MRHFQNQYGSISIDSMGAALQRLNLGGKELLHDFKDEARLWCAGSVMFPFPVRMASGTVMAFEGSEYHWPINDERHRAALHGLTTWAEFELADLPNGIQASWTYDGSKDYYPFPCRLTIRYTLDERGLTLSGGVENLGSANLPFHLGWHPYFKTNEPVLNPAPVYRLKKNEVSHPGEKIPFEGFDWTKEVDGAFFMEKVELGDVSIQPLSAITQVFRPANAPFVAIEPITGLGHPDFPWRTVLPAAADEVATTIRVEK